MSNSEDADVRMSDYINSSEFEDSSTELDAK